MPPGRFRGILFSCLLHLALLGLAGSLPLGGLGHGPGGEVPAPAAAGDGGPVARRDVLSRGGKLYSGGKVLAWSAPVFSRGELGPAMLRAAGRPLRVYNGDPPFLRNPEFTPYIPPILEDEPVDPVSDVLRLTRPADYGEDELAREEAMLRRTLVQDLGDCRLDGMSLGEALLRLRYLRLRKVLVSRGLAPGFSLEEARNRLDRKLAAIHGEVGRILSPDRFTALLVAFRKDKIYEERRGHSLFNSIFYDLYNCRSGTEELLIYLNRYHPGLKLGSVRGSVRKYDGTVMGHIDPAVWVDGRWLVLKTVAVGTGLVEEYRVGELYPLEKILFDYLPETAGSCGMNRPLASNGEPLGGGLAPYTRSDHPLELREAPSPILLWRETTPYTGPFRVMGREDRLVYAMAGRYRSLGEERGLLDRDDPFADLLFHFLTAPPEDRGVLVDLYLSKRVTARPAAFKRPLRVPDRIPGYGDLMATLSKGVRGGIEIVPGYRVDLVRFIGHDAFVEAAGERLGRLSRPVPPVSRRRLDGAVRRFLLYRPPGEGVVALFPPELQARSLVTALLDDACDLAVPLADERARRENGTSSRAIAVLKAGLLGDPEEGRRRLRRRVGLLEAVLAGKKADRRRAGQRARHEPRAALDFETTIVSGGREGLSPGFIKDMVEFMGEDEAVRAFTGYLRGAPAALADRRVTAEMFGYLDAHLLLERNRARVAEAARDILARHPSAPARAGADGWRARMSRAASATRARLRSRRRWASRYPNISAVTRRSASAAGAPRR